MSFQSVQISPEEFTKYADFGRKQAEAEVPASGIQVNANQGFMSMNTHGGEVSHQGIQRVTAEDYKTAGIVGSLGLTPMSPKAVVDIGGGMQTTLEQAHAMGLVGRDGSGRYFDFESKK